jgi:hypothetical protein
MWYQHASYHAAAYATHHPSSFHHFHFNEVVTLTVLVESGAS